MMNLISKDNFQEEHEIVSTTGVIKAVVCAILSVG